MKKITICGIALFLMLLSFILIGCPTEDEDSPSVVGITFVDNLTNPAKELVINNNLSFSVKFIEPNALEAGFNVGPGDVISGKIIEATAAWNRDLTGVATQMSSTNSTFASVLPAIDVVISLDYTEVNGEITAIELALEGTGVAAIANTLMGGTYVRK